MPVTKNQIAQRGQYRTKVLDDSGHMSESWARHLQSHDVAIQNLPQFFFNTAAVMATTDPTRVNIGSQFRQTDTGHTFISDGHAWRQIA